MPSITVDGASIPAERGEAMREAMQRAVCRVVAIADLTHDIRRFRLAVESGGPFEFSAGQYARVEFAPGIHREYSMANPPHDSALEFPVRRTANGLASSHVFTRLAIGDPVRVEGPLGTSYLRERHAGPILLAAGGSGMAPMFSILESALRLGLSQPIRLYFGVREARDFYGEDQLVTLAARHPNFRYDVVLSAADAAIPRFRMGMLHEAIAADWADLEVAKAYLAGPPMMVEAVSDLLRERGVALCDIHADAYYTEADKARLQPAHGLVAPGLNARSETVRAATAGPGATVITSRLATDEYAHDEFLR